MRLALSVLLGLGLVGFLVMAARADEESGKEVTLKGTILCAKCELHETKKCTNAIRVEKEGTKTVYYFDDKGAKEKYHKNICMEPKEGSVTGTVSEKEGKKYIKPKKDGVKFTEG
jgi:hypothetical protein